MPQTMVEALRLESEPISQFPALESDSLRGPLMPQFCERSFIELFEQQAKQTPSQVAVIASHKQFTYSELNERANRLAHHLRALGVGRESLVGICIDRSVEMAIGIVGILKSGGAYLPLDPDYPKDRLAFMVQDAQPAVIITKSSLVRAFAGIESKLVLLDEPRAFSSFPAEDFREKPQPTDLAYVIYTSGSTGQPKGVMIEHRNLSNYLLALNLEIGVEADDVYLHLASIAFSSSRRQLLLPLSQGATVLIAGNDERKDPLKLFRTIKTGCVTVMDAVPSFWRNCTTILRELDEAERRELLNNNVRLMLSASEPLTADIPRTWRDDFNHPARHVHMFGQTETAGIVCINQDTIESDDEERVAIGRPIANTEIRILDEEMSPCAPGEAGELFIGGAGVGRGYLNRPELTSEKFVTNDNGRFYRTGDFARVRANGKLEFAGRRDQQIKIRGFRVELTEVEAALAAHGAVRECAVVPKMDAQKNVRLAAYFASKAETPVSELRTFLNGRLPEHAIPATFIELDALPLSANGKVNRLALTEREDSFVTETNAFVAPGTESEQKLSAIFSEVLQVPQVGIDDNFFELGGNSLLAGQAIARVRRAFATDTPITVLFNSPTVRGVAACLKTARKDESITALQRVARDEPLPLSSAQHRLWFLDQLEPDNHAYNLAHAIEIRGALNVDALRKACDALVSRHEILRTRFVVSDGTPYQQIDLPAEADWQLINLAQAPAECREDEARARLVSESRQPFNLETGPLMRVRLVQIEGDRFILLLTFHHIVSDGWSAGILANELGTAYDAFVRNTSPEWPQLSVQYADYAAWQRDSLTPEALESQVAYWKERLRGAPPVLNLPTDFARGEDDSYRGAKEVLRLPAELTNKLKAFSRSQDATLFMTLFAAFDAVLARYSGAEDIVVGTPIAGRTRVEAEPLIGMFVNTLPLRVKVSPEQTVRELVGSVRENSLAAYANQDVPFETLVSELQCDRTSPHHPIFQAMFALQNARTPLPALVGLETKALELPSDTAKFDLSLDVIDGDEGLDLAITYASDLFAAESARHMLSDYLMLLEAVVANPDARVADLPLLSWRPKQAAAQVPATASHQAAAYVAPRSPIEEKLAAIWTEVLNVDQIGVEDNFFMLGGHSLMATQLIGRIRNAFGYELPLRRLFQTPTIAGLADAIYESQTTNTELDEFTALMAELEALTDDEAQELFEEEKAA